MHADPSSSCVAPVGGKEGPIPTLPLPDVGSGRVSVFPTCGSNSAGHGGHGVCCARRGAWYCGFGSMAALRRETVSGAVVVLGGAATCARSACNSTLVGLGDSLRWGGDVMAGGVRRSRCLPPR
jgi:hypothetical protein